MIRYWDRRKGREEVEEVYGGGLLRFLYGTALGRRVLGLATRRAAPSRLYGLLQDLPISRLRIGPFVRRFTIPMGEFEDRPFRSFNDFFTRRFRPGVRSFTEVGSELPAFAEGRYLAFEEAGREASFPVKNFSVSLPELLGGEEIARPFLGGPLLIVRLCPTDYHRFHFPDDGRIVSRCRIGGLLHSVNPHALRADGRILLKNEREVSLLETKNFGRLAFVEIGALLVGKIVQMHPIDRPFRRGDEKGFFRFGASSIVLAGECGAWRPDDDLLGQTGCGMETLVRLGERVAGR